MGMQQISKIQLYFIYYIISKSKLIFAKFYFLNQIQSVRLKERPNWKNEPIFIVFTIFSPSIFLSGIFSLVASSQITFCFLFSILFSKSTPLLWLQTSRKDLKVKNFLDMIFQNPHQIVQIQIIMGKKTKPNYKIPKFIKKLIQILQDPNFSDLIQWVAEGNGFQILKASLFSEKVLPIYFKHNNMASFVRQLNMYGFNRPKDSNQHVYIHMRFQKGNTNSLKFIKRKSSHMKSSGEDSQNSFTLSEEEKASDEDIIGEYKKLLMENQYLRKQNEELVSKLKEFQDLKEKLRRCNEQARRYISFLPIQIQLSKSDQQTISTNWASERAVVCRREENKAFHKPPQMNYQQRSIILLSGVEKNGQRVY